MPCCCFAIDYLRFYFVFFFAPLLYDASSPTLFATRAASLPLLRLYLRCAMPPPEFTPLMIDYFRRLRRHAPMLKMLPPGQRLYNGFAD